MDMKKASVIASLQAISVSPILSHMRQVAYSPVKLHASTRNEAEIIRKAEEKRAKRMERNIKNANK